MEDSIDLPPHVCSPAGLSTGSVAYQRTSRKRGHIDEESIIGTEVSSDPALFSSDEPAASVETYAAKRRKQVWQGTWWGERDENESTSRGEFKRNFDSGVFLSSDSAQSDVDENENENENENKNENKNIFDKEEDGEGGKSWLLLEIAERRNPLRPQQTHHTCTSNNGTQRSPTKLQHPASPGSDSLPSRYSSRQKLAHCPLRCPRNEDNEVLRFAKRIISQCVQDGNETVDLSSLHLGDRLRSEFLQLKTLIQTSSIQETPSTSQEHAYEPLIPNIKLFLASNRLKRLAKEIFELENLVVLSIRQNELRRLPDAFRRLTRLEELNVSGNRLDSLPYAILNLIKEEKLRKLSTFPNPFKEFDENETARLVELPAKDGPILTAESQPTFYWKSGKPANIQQIMRQIPQLRSDYMNQHSQCSRQGAKVPTSLPVVADSVPSLVELALRECSRQEDFVQDTDYLKQEEDENSNPDITACASFSLLPDGQRHSSEIMTDMLKAGQAVWLEGGKRCTVCNRDYIIQRASWYEWYQLSNAVAVPSVPDADDKVQSLNVVPFYREACSLACYVRRAEMKECRAKKT